MDGLLSVELRRFSDVLIRSFIRALAVAEDERGLRRRSAPGRCEALALWSGLGDWRGVPRGEHGGRLEVVLPASWDGGTLGTRCGPAKDLSGDDE